MSEMDFAQARFNMIECQVRPWEVLDPDVLHSMETVPRDGFVPTQYRNLAYADTTLPLGHEQMMLAPRVEARIVQALQLQAGERVLLIGAGSGYLAALLAQQCNHVDSVEFYEDLTQQAKANLNAYNIRNVDVQNGDAVNGWNREFQYDAIVLTASLPAYNTLWQEQLAVGGRLFVVTGAVPVMQANLITRITENEWLTDTLFETVIPAMVGATTTSAFNL